MLGHNSAWMTLDVYADLFDSDPDHVSAAIDSVVEECGQNVGTAKNVGKKKGKKHWYFNGFSLYLRVGDEGLEPPTSTV